VRIIKLTVLILLFVQSFIAQASVVDSAKTAILVDDTNANDPIKLKQAFAQILFNRTGEDIIDILNAPIFNDINIKAGVKRSYFEKIELKYLPVGSDHKYWFNVIMQEDFINKVIDHAGFSLLPNNRKQTMVWISVEKMKHDIETANEQIGMYLDYGYNDEVSIYWLKHWAQALAMVLKFPSLDQGDKSLVSPESIKNLSFQAIELSKQRYFLDQVLMLYIKKDTLGGIKIRSGLVINDDDIIIKHIQQDNNDEASAFYATLSEIAQNISNVYKINSESLQKHTIYMVLDSISSYDEISKLRKYLSTLSVIESYSIVAAKPGKLDLNVDLLINNAEFLKIIARDEVLTSIPDGPINKLIFETNKL
jgi:hypothetical protein